MHLLDPNALPSFEDMKHEEILNWMLTSGFDIQKCDEALAKAIMDQLKKTREEEREALWDSDMAIWCEDRMGVAVRNFKWSEFGGDYDKHEWESRIYDRVKNEYGEWTYPSRPLKDPLWYAGHVLGTVPEARVIMPSGTGLGKTYWAAHVVYWWLDTKRPRDRDLADDCKVLYLANAIKQLGLNIGAEIQRLLPRFQKIYPNAEYMTSTVAVYPDAKNKAARDSWLARGYGTAAKAGDGKAGGIKGIHAKSLLIIQEEIQSALESVLASVIDTLRGPDNKFLGLGNPLGEYDMAYKMATRADATWIGVSSLDFPNVVLGENIVPGAVGKGDIERTWEVVDHDADHEDWVGPILGRFPTGGANAIIKNSLAVALRSHQLRPEEARLYRNHDSEARDTTGYTAFYRPPRTDYIRWCYVAMDIAGDKNDGDYHVAIFFDRISREPFGIIRMRGNRVDFFNEVVKCCHENSTHWAARGINYVPLVSWERNFHSPTRETVIGQYPNRYKPRSMDKAGRDIGSIEGFHTNKKTRIEMQARLEEWLSLVERQVMEDQQPALYIEEMLHEFTRFVAQPKTGPDDKTIYRAAPGAHDDVIMALGQVLAIDAERQHLQPIKIVETDAQMADSQGRGSNYGREQYQSEERGIIASSSRISNLDRYQPRKWRK